MQLKGLWLVSMPALQNLGLERDPVLQRIDSLMIENCPLLIKLVPPSVTLTLLTYLEIESCHGLTNLMAPSTAKSLVHLRIMKVIQCKGMKEIVATEDNNEETAVKVVFSKLITLELDSLTNLASFCSSKNHDFDFPLLENLVVRDCPKMKIFAEGVITAPNLQKISDDKGKWDWEGDLNVTIEKGFVSMTLRVAKFLKLGDHAELEEMWQGVVPVPNGSFSNLKSLVVENCDFLSTVIPCHILSILNNLEELEVENCDSVKVIFDVKDGTRSSLSSPLKKLTLRELPNLEHVWKEDPKGLVSFQTMKNVYVDRCKGIQSLFPASVAEGLIKLETLEVRNCEELEQIVAMDEVAEEGVAKKFVFHCLTSLILQELTRLKYFYPGSHEMEIECPKFEKVQVCHCNKLTTIKSSDSQPALFSLEKAIPNVEVLSLNEKETMMSWEGKFSEGFLQNVKFLWLVSFHNVGEADFLPYEFLQRVPNIENLGVYCAGYKEIFPYQTVEVECIKILAQLKKLYLSILPRLKSTGLEHSWLQPLLETLEIIRVHACPCLTKLVQSTASFSNLKELHVSECHGLEYLFTSSTAKRLVKLEKMSIDECKTIKEIVAKEEDESAEDEDEIIFGKLKQLILENLSRLVSFYNGNYILKFPSLEWTAIVQCPRMEFFSHGVISAPKLHAIQVSQEAYHERWEGDLNTTIKELYFKEKVSFEFSEHLKLSEYPELEQAWQQKDLLCFRKLKTLVMENLKFLSKAIPSHLLPYLKNLEELQVQKCTSIEVIFDTKDAKQAFLLKKLTLNGLPNMKNVWDGDLQGNLVFDNLQEVDVTNCEGLKALFPASMAKNLKKLKKLRIETCQAMAEIVGKEDEEAVEETTSMFVFPRLSSMTLCLMPELRCFYNGKHILQCPMLKDLRVSHCGELEIFTLESQSFQEAQPENHDSISKGSEPLFSIQKVTPNLEELSLNEKETMMLWHADYTANLLIRVIHLQLYCFHNVKEGDTLPYGFLQKVPNIETLAVACSDFHQVFHSHGDGVDDEVKRLLLQLKGLRLENLSKLKSIGLENSWLDTLSENLKILEVSRCSSLTKLVESPVSFTNLRELLVSKSGGLEYLFTSKTALSLVQLRRISIEECESIKGLIAGKGDDSTQDEIIFEKLGEISLNSLSSLSSFYMGNSVLKFPSLDKVIIAQCPKMEFFSQGFVSAPMLIRVQTSLDKDDILWEGDLNATVKKMFKGKIAQ